MRINTKADKGVTGLTILLSLVVMLFVIGLITMIFTLMGGELRDATYTSTTSTVTNETGAWLNITTYTVDNSGALHFTGLTITGAYNVSNISAPTVIGTGNFTVSGTGYVNSSVSTWPNVSLSYTYIYDADNTATDVMNDTVVEISGVVDWFDIFIVIGAMVVLILLTVIIITAIRGSGLIEGGA